MASSIKFSTLPSSVAADETDLLLLGDLQNSVFKKIDIDTLNSSLMISKCKDYIDLTSEISGLESVIDGFIGEYPTGVFPRTMAEINTDLTGEITLNVNRYNSLSTRLDVVEDSVDSQQGLENANLAVLMSAVSRIQDNNFQAGLAKGFLYVDTITIGDEVL